MSRNDRPGAPRYRFRGSLAPEARKRTPILAEAPQLDSAEEGVVRLRLYDPIDSWGGPWGISAKEFVEALDQVGTDVEQLELHINSPGGEVFEGIAILNALRTHPARVVAHVDGLAASAASFIATGADEVVMGRNTELMIHDAWGLAIGPAADMRDMAKRLDQLSDNIASVYYAKAGGSISEWRDAMLAETWFSAQEALDAGLADRIEGVEPAAAAKNAFDLSVFKHQGRSQAPEPHVARSQPVPPPVAPDEPDNDRAARFAQRRHQNAAHRHRLAA